MIPQKNLKSVQYLLLIIHVKVLNNDKHLSILHQGKNFKRLHLKMILKIIFLSLYRECNNVLITSAVFIRYLDFYIPWMHIDENINPPIPKSVPYPNCIIKSSMPFIFLCRLTVHHLQEKARSLFFLPIYKSFLKVRIFPN